MRKPFIRTMTLLSATLIVFAANCTNLLAQENNTKGIRTLYLIRHGQYDHDDDRDPDIGKALIPLGIAQSRLVAGRLKSLPVTMNSLISSTMTRARQTAMIINQDFPELELRQTRLIRECTPYLAGGYNG